MLLSPCILPLPLSLPCATDVAPHGAYVEARTASVYAGACHYGGEATLAGREALLAWRIESGSQAGVDLAGAGLAIAIADEVNLAEGAHVRRSIVYLDASLPATRQAAVCAWLAQAHAELLGEVLAVRSIALTVAVDEKGYALTAPGIFELSGGPMPDRACCKMPYNVWYAPFVSLSARLVGNDSVFRFEDAALGASWSRPNENAAFVGRF